MKSKSKTGGYIIRSAVVAALFWFAVVAFTLAVNSPRRWLGLSSRPASSPDNLVKAATQTKTLTFADRVAYQRAIEEVYWRHRTWPAARADAKPSLDKVMSQAQLETKVEDYLCNSQALEEYWHKPITSKQLQAEMDRMAEHTKQPEVLQELFEALGNDPAVVAECLARPVLTEHLIADVSVQDKTRRFESARTSRLRTMSMVTTLGNQAYDLPKISEPDSACTFDTWAGTHTTNAPDKRSAHTAVWTGSEMIVWGGYDGTTAVNTGGRYSPSTDTWVATSTANAPPGRWFHTAIWTGSEMIVWGGTGTGGITNTGGRYNPTTDRWTATSLTNAPSPREFHTAVWSGSEMIVWGGYNGSNTGGRYNPTTDRWTATSLTNAPDARSWHTAIWTGSEMIVWGGGPDLNTGGRYNPSIDRWVATSATNAPSGRAYHTAVWTGSQMIVWGGSNGNQLNTGGKYNPTTDSWTATSLTNVPDGREFHTAIWTGSEMIVWGGYNGPYLNTGGRYNATTDSWTATSLTNVPRARSQHTAIWTASQMIVWGGDSGVSGLVKTGGKYCSISSVQVTVQTTPAGLTFSVDGTTYSSAQTFIWASGSSHTIATTSPQSGGTGVQYIWSMWSDHGAISHTVAPTTNKTYTATFRTQYYLTMSHGTGGTVSPASGWKNSGPVISISAMPARGYSFTNWTGSGTGSYSGTKNPTSITMGGPITEKASFTQN